MTMITLQANRRASPAVLSSNDRNHAINALKMIRAMTVPHGSPAEARILAEIADHWANNDGDD